MLFTSGCRGDALVFSLPRATMAEIYPRSNGCNHSNRGACRRCLIYSELCGAHLRLIRICTEVSGYCEGASRPGKELRGREGESGATLWRGSQPEMVCPMWLSPASR